MVCQYIGALTDMKDFPFLLLSFLSSLLPLPIPLFLLPPLLPTDEVEVRDRLSSVTSVVSLEEQVEFLQEKLEMLQSQCSGSE